MDRRKLLKAIGLGSLPFLLPLIPKAKSVDTDHYVTREYLLQQGWYTSPTAVNRGLLHYSHPDFKEGHLFYNENKGDYHLAIIMNGNRNVLHQRKPIEKATYKRILESLFYSN